VQFDIEQQRIIDAILKRKYDIVSIDASAGTGKSTIIHHLKKVVHNTVVGCPTGQAASIVGGVTIHSLFGIPTLGTIDPARDVSVGTIRARQKETRFFARRQKGTEIRPKIETLKAIRLLILDEVGMIRCDHFDFIDKALRDALKQPRLAFGGVQVALFGDCGQLSSIADDKQTASLKKLGYTEPFGFNESAILRDLPA